MPQFQVVCRTEAGRATAFINAASGSSINTSSVSLMAKVQFLLCCLFIIVLLTPLTQVRPGVYQLPTKPRVSWSSGSLDPLKVKASTRTLHTNLCRGGRRGRSLLRQQGRAFLCRGRGLCLHRGGVNNKVNNLHKMEVKNKTLQQLKYPARRLELPVRAIKMASQRILFPPERHLTTKTTEWTST